MIAAYWIILGIILIVLMALNRFFYLSSLLVVVLVAVSVYYSIQERYDVIKNLPEEDVLYIHHQIRTEEKVILIWAINMNQEDRLYEIPDDEESKRVLRDASKRKRLGFMTVLSQKEGVSRNESTIYKLHGKPVAPKALPEKQ